MLRRLALYRVLRIACVAAPAIFTYRWLLLRERLGGPRRRRRGSASTTASRAACTTSASSSPASS